MKRLWNPFRQNSLLITVISVSVFLTACQKKDAPFPIDEKAKQTAKKCACENEEAFPEIQGEVISLKDKNGDEKAQLIKKNDKYILGGDVILTQEQVNLLKNQISGSDTAARTGLAQIAKFWPNRTVVFIINPNLPDQARVTNAIAHWQTQTNLRFVQRTTQANYIEFVPGTGCSSDYGMIGGRQVITLANECSTGNTIHEIGHAIGFFHEQSRADRDNFVVIHSNNIADGKDHNFKTYPQLGLQGFQIGTFDFGSIMLYDSYAFSKNGLPTITRPDGSTFSTQRIGLSAGDIETYNYMYNRPYFVKDRDNFRDDSGSDYYQYIWDAHIRVFTDQSMTTPLTLTTPWRLLVKKTTTWSNYPTPSVEYVTITIPAGSNSIRIGEDSYYAQYVGGSENLTTEVYWTLENIVVSRP